MLMEVQRVLKTGGIYVALSYGGPERRLSHFLRSHLGFEVHTEKLQRVENGHTLIHYCYICIKEVGADGKVSLNWATELEKIKKEEAELFQEGSDDSIDEVDEGMLNSEDSEEREERLKEEAAN